MYSKKWFNPDKNRAWPGIQTGPELIKAMQLGVNRWARGHSFSVELHITVFQTDIYAIKTCVMENP